MGSADSGMACSVSEPALGGGTLVEVGRADCGLALLANPEARLVFETAADCGLAKETAVDGSAEVASLPASPKVVEARTARAGTVCGGSALWFGLVAPWPALR